MKALSTNPLKQIILAVNGGSSSIKFSLYEADKPLRRIFKGEIERIGLPGPILRVKGLNPAESITHSVMAPDYETAVSVMMDWLETNIKCNGISVVGHRVVHGGSKYFTAQPINKDVINDLRQFSPFDPEHLPAEIHLIEAFAHRFPDLPQVACFDTAFHHGLPRIAQIIPIPRRYEKQGVRRYGFHGLSYQFLMEELATSAGLEATEGRIILAHLGNGSSLAAVKGGKPVDTSMGFTPTSGILMGTRSGDLDPGVFGYLAHTEKMTARQYQQMVNHESGLLGVSETSSDMRDLLAQAAEDSRASEAVELFCYAVKKRIGSYAAALGGLNTLVFAGGIGENAPTVRARICDGLGFLGIELDKRQNLANKEGLISRANQPVAIHLIHTDEEQMIARSVSRLLAFGLNREKSHHNLT